MHQVNVTELRNHLQKYLSRAQKGKEILVTLHGQVIARLVPPADTREHAVKKLKALRDNAKICDITSPIDENWDAEK